MFSRHVFGNISGGFRVFLGISRDFAEIPESATARNITEKPWFNVQTINCMQYNSEPVVLNSINIKLGRNRANEINTHTEHLVQKHNDLL